MSDFDLEPTRVMELAKESVDKVVEEMPEDLSQEEEKAFLANTGKVFGRACMILQEMVREKKITALH